MKPRALITGVTGQDGWYLRELLEGKDYEVYGWRRDECDEHALVAAEAHAREHAVGVDEAKAHSKQGHAQILN